MYNYVKNIPVIAFFADEDGLLTKHWEEIAGNKDKIKLCPDVSKYIHLQEAGVLKNICAYKDEKLIGYCVMFVQPHLHYAEDLYAYVDVIYVDKEYRNTSVGIRLIKETEEYARSLNVSVLTYHTKPAHAVIEKVLAKLNYKHIENIFGKCLKE